MTPDQQLTALDQELTAISQGLEEAAAPLETELAISASLIENLAGRLKIDMTALESGMQARLSESLVELTGN